MADVGFATGVYKFYQGEEVTIIFYFTGILLTKGGFLESFMSAV